MDSPLLGSLSRASPSSDGVGQLTALAIRGNAYILRIRIHPQRLQRGGISVAGLFLDRRIDVVDARQLAFSGGAGRDDKLEGFITRVGRGSATEDDRVALVAFLEGDDAVVRHDVGPLRNAWYGWA